MFTIPAWFYETNESTFMFQLVSWEQVLVAILFSKVISETSGENASAFVSLA